MFDADYAFVPGPRDPAARGHRRPARLDRAADGADPRGGGAPRRRRDRGGVLHVPSIKPVDERAIAAAADDVPLVVTVEEHSVIGGLGGLVAEILATRAPRPLVRIGIEDTWGESAPNAWLLERHGLTPEAVAERVRKARPGMRGRPARTGGLMHVQVQEPDDIGVAVLGAGRMGRRTSPTWPRSPTPASSSSPTPTRGRRDAGRGSRGPRALDGPARPRSTTRTSRPSSSSPRRAPTRR